jgi:hypothetical protein
MKSATHRPRSASHGGSRHGEGTLRRHHSLFPVVPKLQPQQDHPTNSSSNSSSRSRSSGGARPQFELPTAVCALHQLDKVLPAVLQHMSAETVSSCKAACLLLDQAAESPSDRLLLLFSAMTSMTQPATTTTASTAAATSSDHIPLFSWPTSLSPRKNANSNIIDSNHNHQSQHHSNNKNDSDYYYATYWDRFVRTPFKLLAVAELCAADLFVGAEVVVVLEEDDKEMDGSTTVTTTTTTTTTTTVQTMYQRCLHDLKESRRVLCESPQRHATLSNAKTTMSAQRLNVASSVTSTICRNGENIATNNNNNKNDLALVEIRKEKQDMVDDDEFVRLSVHTTLTALMEYISCKCQFWQIMIMTTNTTTAATSSSSSSLAELQLRLLQEMMVAKSGLLLGTKKTTSGGVAWGAAAPLIQALLQQIQAVMAGLETCWAMERAL